MQNYTIPKPSLPFVARALGGLLVIGLIGLGTAAYVAFAYIGHWWQALAFALVVELCGVIEALAIMRGNRFAIPGLAISLAVSVSYNWTQAEQAAALLATPLSFLQLAALAIGPMSAVFFVALTLGHELRAHEQAVVTWEQERQKWADDQAEREARRVERRELRQERAVAQLPPVQVTQLAQEARAMTQPGTYEDFRLAQMVRNGAGPMDYRQVMAQFNVSRRTAYRWLAQYQETHPEPIPGVN